MKNKLIFILWLLMFSFFSCDFGIKENEETNSKEYFTVKGSCSIQGAIPSDLFPEKSIKQNAQRTVVPKIEIGEITVSFESETGDTKSAEVVNKDFEIELPPGKWTVKAQGKKSDDVIIESESCQIELPAENTNVKLVLKPTQSDTEKGTFKFSFGMETTKVSRMKYTYKKNGDTEPQPAIINNFSEQNIDLSSGVYTFRFDFYSSTDELLYSFKEVVNIFDGLTTDTWIGAGEYIEDGKICINDTMISNFVSTTVYVSNDGDDSNLGTFFEPVKTIQNAVNKVIDMNEVTTSSEGNPYKILLLSDIYIPSNDSFESNNNAFVNINPSSASDIPLYLTISKCGDGKATINANRTDTNTGRVMYIGENANVTLKNLTLTGGYLKNDNGAGLYILNNNANVKIENSEIRENKIDNGSGAGLRVKHQADKRLNLTIKNSKISSNKINHNAAIEENSGAGIAIENVAVTLTITNSEISENVIDQEDVDAYTPKAKGVGLCLGTRATTTISGTAITNNIIENAASTNENAGGGVYLNGGTLTIQNSTENNTVISGNSSTIGGGVAVTTATSASTTGSVSMSGGTISGNIVTSSDGSVGNGSAVAVLTSGLFTVSDNITIEGDVYLYENQNITVSNNFEGGEVMITPYKYANDGDGVQVLTSIEGTSLTAEIVGKFKVTPQRLGDVHKNWFVDLYGYLGKVPKTETNDDGTVVYLMESYDNLLYIAQGIKTGSITSLNMKLTDDIDIPSGKWQFSELNAPDHSTIDGQGYSITIEEDVSKFGNCAGGLFYKCNYSTVKNLVLKGSITADTSKTVNQEEGRYIGALCRSAYGSIFENVMSEVTITDNGSGFAGGLIGRLGTSVSYDPTKAMVKNCAVYADVSSTHGIAGGILGGIWEVTRCCTIQDSIYMGEIKGPTVGAIVGINENNNVAKSVLNNIWYCVTNNSSIPLIGTKAETTTEDITVVESKIAAEIASDAAANLLNTNSGSTSVVWEYDSGSDYPTLKALSSE